MKPIISVFTVLSIVLFVVACATDYQAKGYTGGFSETQLGENSYRIYFSGNAKTSSERASDFALLRAAELTIENGHQFFIVTESQDKVSTRVIGDEDSVTTQNRPRTDITVRMFDTKPQDSRIVYEAKFVRQSIRGKYKIVD